MASRRTKRRSQIGKDLLDALRGGDPASEQDSGQPARARNGGRDGEDGGAESRGNGSSLRDALKLRDRGSQEAERGGNGASVPDSTPAPPAVGSSPPPSRTSRPPRRTTRPARNEALSFEGIRARAREMAQGFRETGTRAGQNLRAFREGSDGDGGVVAPRRERGGGISPPWRRTPTLPPPPGPRPPSGSGRPRLKKLRLALVLMGVILLAMVSWFFGIMMSVAQDLPALENREQYKHAENSIVVDRNGTELATLTGNERRILIPSEDISQTVKQAVVAVEDQRFYQHRGIDFQGIGRAIVQDVLRQDTVQGASTITQQFVKNALRAQGSRTVFQKLREAALAYHLERRWSKDKILTEYLNSIYFGEGAYGIEAAAQTYFGSNHPGCGVDGNRCASQLAPEEAALLAGMISSPSAYSPRANPEAATDRRNLVLQKMVEQGVLTPEQYTQIAGDGSVGSGTPIPKAGQIEPPKEDSVSPYFTTWLRQQVVDRYGAGEAFGGGLEITSTLDLEYQQAVEEVAYSTLAGIEPTASIVVIDNRTGGVLAMVGGNDYERAPFNLATNGHRQPGSSWKPFTLVSALAQGRSPDEVFSSEPKTFQFKAPGVKEPQKFPVKNYEDTYYGSQSIASATTTSDNSVYAELGLQVGVDNIARTAQKMGIQTDISTNPAMILGGLETGVSPLEMAYAYSTLGRSGQRIGGTMDSVPGSTLGPTGIMKVTTQDDTSEPVEDKTGSSGENDVQTEQVLDAASSDTAVGLLEEVVSSGTGENAATGDFAWGKTGTTDDNGDAWFVGGTEDVTAAVWVGHPNDVTPMETEYSGGPVDGGTYPADIWHDVVIAYESIIGSAKDEDKADDSSSSDTYVPPVEESTAPVAPAPTEEPVAPAPAPEDTAPAPSAPAPSGGGGSTGGGTGATGASRR